MCCAGHPNRTLLCAATLQLLLPSMRGMTWLWVMTWHVSGYPGLPAAVAAAAAAAAS
jgi:hypothetical protein